MFLCCFLIYFFINVHFDYLFGFRLNEVCNQFWFFDQCLIH